VALGVDAVIVADLFSDPNRRSHAAMPEMDPLTEAGALQEADLVAVSFDVLTASAGLLFDLRNALQLQSGNAALLIARGVDRFAWDAQDLRDLPFVSHLVTGSSPSVDGCRFTLSLGMVPDAGLTLRARGAEFFVGDVPGLGEAPPDFFECSADLVRAEMPGWQSVFVPGYATFLDPIAAS